MFYLYILRCCDGSYYVGHRDDLGKRISDHLSGGISVYTRKRRPLQLVFSESFSRREEALARASEGVVTREKGGADQRQLGAAWPAGAKSVLVGFSRVSASTSVPQSPLARDGSFDSSGRTGEEWLVAEDAARTRSGLDPYGRAAREEAG